jgi:DNA-binding MarR family transcriptional regulator
VADAEYLQELEKKKKASTAQLLFRCARLLNEWALSRVRAETGVATIRAAHTSLLPHLGFEGIRLTELSERLGVSKQATHQLVEELEEQGMVERRDDPLDGRAKLIRFSRKGERALLDGLRVLGELERELSQGIGQERFSALHDALSAMMPILEAAADASPPRAPEEPAKGKRHPGVKRSGARPSRGR